METPSSNNTPNNHTAAATQIHLPPFSVIDAPTWFRRAEIQFRLKKLNSSTSRADHVLAALPDDLFPRLAEWLESKGDVAIQYDELKDYLLQRFTPSPAVRASQIFQLSRQPLGDQKPSDALLEMRSMARLTPASDGTPRHLDLLRALWLLRLPESIRAVIPNAEELDEDELRKRADSLVDALSVSGEQVGAVQVDSHCLAQCNDGNIAAAQYMPAHSPKKQTHLQGVKRKICFYHARFGPRARNCQPGCLWSKNL